MGFAEESVIVHESSSSNTTAPIPLRIAKGNVTEIPLIIRFTVDNSSTATPGNGKHYMDKITNILITQFYYLLITYYNSAFYYSGLVQGNGIIHI